MESSPGKETNKASSRMADILQTAEALFCRQGIAETTMDQIAESVPIAKMTLYKYAGSKEKLLDLVLDRMLKRGEADFRSMLNQAETPLDMLTLMTQYRGMDHVAAVFVQDLMRLYPEKGAELIAKQQETLGPLLERTIFEGQQRGQFRKDLSPHVVILFFMGMKEVLSRSDALSGPAGLRAISEQIMSIFFHGIVAQEQKNE
ncbi:TetR/AcrR family transcriptional regulator [Paenibacillus thermotolerans]|uniref:TetR/AcrR family transcriptional regulator n=1 Tax=Paenibacillus thermotolerans TaxID=3027807 RepID=UPI002368BE92|nr:MULTISPECIES: TetR/AcrR family transcriptional regulator [unclassified Paenibacillus]